jgi:hypothetical protein
MIGLHPCEYFRRVYDERREYPIACTQGLYTFSPPMPFSSGVAPSQKILTASPARTASVLGAGPAPSHAIALRAVSSRPLPGTCARTRSYRSHAGARMRARSRGTWCAQPSARSLHPASSRSASRVGVESQAVADTETHVGTLDRDAAGDDAVDLSVRAHERREDER